MTKKDYELIAGAICAVRANVSATERQPIDSLISVLSARLMRENARFNYSKFEKACGMY